MSGNHGPIIQKPISEIANFIRNLIPANIPDNYELKPLFENIGTAENIRNGVIAYRDFLYQFFDLLSLNGHLYAKPLKKPKSESDYPFIYGIADLLSDIGYYGKLSEDENYLILTKIPSFINTIDEDGNIKKPKNSITMLIDCMQFLTLCGFNFNGIDLKGKKPNISEIKLLEVSYPHNPILLTGLKALSIADIDIRTKRYMNDNNHDNLLRCDYRLLKAEESDAIDILKDFLHPLPEKVQELALDLHKHYIEKGMTCAIQISTFEVHISYSNIKNSKKVFSTKKIYQQRIWEFALTIRNGYCLVVRSKKTDKYTDIIENFSSVLKEKIQKGYGCDRKLHNESCQCGCQGIRIPLNDSILNISEDIETWLDMELYC